MSLQAPVPQCYWVLGRRLVGWNPVVPLTWLSEVSCLMFLSNSLTLCLSRLSVLLWRENVGSLWCHWRCMR